MSRCPTTHGSFRCDLTEGHGGECETKRGPTRRPALVVDLDSQREFSRAAKRIVQLERRVVRLDTALMEIRTMSCEAGEPCACCKAHREIAIVALEDAS